MVQHLPSVLKAQSSIPSGTKNNSKNYLHFDKNSKICKEKHFLASKLSNCQSQRSPSTLKRTPALPEEDISPAHVSSLAWDAAS